MRLKRCRRPMTRQLRCGVWGAKDRRVEHAVRGHKHEARTQGHSRAGYALTLSVLARTVPRGAATGWRGSDRPGTSSRGCRGR